MPTTNQNDLHSEIGPTHSNNRTLNSTSFRDELNARAKGQPSESTNPFAAKGLPSFKEQSNFNPYECANKVFMERQTYKDTNKNHSEHDMEPNGLMDSRKGANTSQKLHLPHPKDMKCPKLDALTNIEDVSRENFQNKKCSFANKEQIYLVNEHFRELCHEYKQKFWEMVRFERIKYVRLIEEHDEFLKKEEN